MSQRNQQDQSKELHIKLGQRELMIRRQYKTASIINDFFITLWFTLSSIFLRDHSLEVPAIWLFILGSAQLLIRPTIRLIHGVHLQEITESTWEC